MPSNMTLDSTMTVELIKLIPSILWIFLVLMIFFSFKDTVRDNILPNMGSIRGFGIEITIAREQMDKSFEKWKITGDGDERAIALSRAKRIASLLQGAKILWMDDEPETLIEERLLIGQLGISIDFFTKCSEAISKLEKYGYDLIISDIKYKNSNGMMVKNNLLEEMVKKKIDIPLIYYISNYDKERGTPAHAFGITERPDQLLHLILDVIERKRS